MRKIYCFVENETDILDEFFMKYEDDEIHLYSSVIESCEDELFYCFAQIISVFLENQEKGILVTDVQEVYELAQCLCGSLFEEIIYLEQNTKREFQHKLSMAELLDFSCKLMGDATQIEIFETLCKNNVSDLLFFYEISERIRKVLADDTLQRTAYWSFLCKALLYMGESEEIKMAMNYKLFLVSLLMKLEHNVKYTNLYLEMVLQSKCYQKENYYFVWNQFKNIRLRKLAESNDKTMQLLDELYKKSYQGYQGILQEKLRPLSEKYRRKERVLVMTVQFLGEGHAPTRTVVERCKALKKLGKEVFLVNTTEQYTAKGYVPLYDALGGKICAEYDELQEMVLGDEVVSFYQLPATLTIMERFYRLEALIKTVKPYYILSIGSGSMLADLCGNIVPCASMALAFSTLPYTMNRMKILGRNLRGNESLDFEKTDIIESRFTFELKQQKEYFTREKWGIPQEQFVLVVVGIRLDYEVTEEFFQVLEQCCSKGCFVVFAGVFENYGKAVARYSELKKNSSFIGYCNDMLALMEICDLYINPKRLGGGFSVIEAFEKGVPGVYLKTGDVYAAGGEAFSVKDYKEMEHRIVKYKEDTDFYQEMSQKARERARLMTSSIDAVSELDCEICRRVAEEYW